MDEHLTSEEEDRLQRERFERIFHTEFMAVLRYAAMRADLDVAKDAAAQTFLVAWRRREELPDPPRAWLLGITRRTLADSRRSQRRQDALRWRLAGTEGASTEQDPTIDIATDRELVRLALEQLTEADAELLRLVYWDDLSRGQAAEVLGCSVTAAKVRLLRARRRLKRVVDKLDEVRGSTDADTHLRSSSARDAQVPTPQEAS